ncbi:glycoside hydrolase family 3 protein [Lasiosphaeria miniovina]|uniref:xylan 1,4-beta-xylosidase n=1 Tax=Lasiosphaeria miniovina TaxID=1954250 RepID=A0AA40ECB2_9PEZI|nr:glycoside hydrolase family 3 protein [Lasiosphaeria miniovina]KAK0734735.1 glycoside hydrolase family 3 protein [Lasiosphaeria miniovina]
MKLPLFSLAGALLVANGARAFQFPNCAQSPLANTTACDIKASPADRAAALVKMLNITEKLSNLVDNSLGAERVGLPPYEWWSEALHGVAASPGVSFNRTGSPFSSATSFANSITISAAFDDDLVYKIATVISTEARAFINAGRAGLDFWTPNINPYKDPRWGRGSETPGEDPVRIKGYVKALLSGLEGDEAVRKVIATCKHYAAYDLERWQGMTRYKFDAVVSSQDLSEYYLPPFQQCARDSHVGSIMCSYNALNGTPACASTYLMDDILRGHWNWTAHGNYVTSDCNAIQDFLPSWHNFSQTPAAAAAAALVAGTDTICEVAGFPPMSDVAGAYNQSLLSEAVVDRALRRLYEGLIRAGYLDPPAASPYRSIGWADVNTPAAQALALQSAAEGMVLLKNNNNNALPLRLANKSVALVGHWAAGGRQMLGGYSGIPPYLLGPASAAQQRNLTYRIAGGPVAQLTGAANTWTAPALAAASQADVVFYFGGTDQSIAAEDRDRDAIAWPGAQLALITTLAALGKPLVVIQLGDQVDDTPLLRNANVSAILWAGYPGQAGGAAALDIITGVSAPAGRLPVTQYPAAYTEQVALTETALRGNGGSPGRTYRWYNGSVLPFGFGLHYTTFDARSTSTNTTTYSIPALLASCNAPHLDLCPFGAVRVQATNTGTTTTSDYVALAFVRHGHGTGPEPRPRKTLAAYARLRAVAPGRAVTEDLRLTLGNLARVDGAGNTVLYPGTYTLLLDVDEHDGAVDEVRFELVGDEVVLDHFPQPRT